VKERGIDLSLVLLADRTVVERLKGIVVARITEREEDDHDA
jgi:hypothetical protein